jgi:uncharacterized membrane protein
VRAVLRKLRKNLRYVFGFVALVAGTAFMFIPFIPLGYMLLAVGAFLLYPLVPVLRRLVEYFEKKDKSNTVRKIENKVNNFFEPDDEAEGTKNENSKTPPQQP